MGKSIRYGPRFCNGSISRTRGAGLGFLTTQPNFEKKGFPYTDKEPTHEERVRRGVKGGQTRSDAIRKAKGIKPSMPTFSFDPKPPPPPPAPTFDYLKLAEMLIPGSSAVEIILEQNHHLLITMLHDSKTFTACLNTKSGKIMWTEGPAPYFAKQGAGKRKNGANKRKDV